MGGLQAMASLSRLSVSLSRLSTFRPSFTAFNLKKNYVGSWVDLPSSGKVLRTAKGLHHSGSNTGRRLQVVLGASGTSVAKLSVEEVILEPPTAHTLSIIDPVTPICERPGTSIASLIDLCRWRNQAKELATSVGSTFVDVDGGPDVSDLLRELEWLLDDAVAACASRPDIVGRRIKKWKPCAWREIKALQIVELEGDVAREDPAAFGVDVSAIYGAYGALCKDRQSDPVNEFAADNGWSCDCIRETLAEMASNDEMSPESQAQTGKKAGVQLLLRMSIEELDRAWKERIQKRRPFQYVVAAAHWKEYVLGVVEGVLIPRPETEQIVDLAEAAIAADKSLGQGVWTDLGTGSGAIAIALGHLLDSSGSVVAIDASSVAVQVAKRNIERYHLQNKVNVLQGFWFSPLQDKIGELAGVVSNPPYIPSGRLAGLQAEVGRHEPMIALDGGPDGMDDLREICSGSATALRLGGFLALESDGGEQAEFLCDLLSTMRVLGSSGVPLPCFRDVKSVKDFAGITRFVTAFRC